MERTCYGVADLKRVSRAVLAGQVFGVNPATVSRWVSEGMPRNEDGTFNVLECVEWALEQARTEAAGTAHQETEESKKWLAQYRKERALLARIDRETKEGTLLPRDKVTAAWRNRYSHFRRHLLLWSKRLPGRLMGLDEREAGRVLDDEVRFLLGLLARPGKFTPAPESDKEDTREKCGLADSTFSKPSSRRSSRR